MTILETLQEKKIILLEEFILEQARLVEKYHWKCSDPKDMNKLDDMCKKLNIVTEEINIAKE